MKDESGCFLAKETAAATATATAASVQLTNTFGRNHHHHHHHHHRPRPKKRREMVQRKYIVNRLQTSASAMLSSTKVQLTAGGLLILALAFLSTLVYLFYLKEPTSVGSEPFSSTSKLNSNEQQQQIAHYRQQFVRNLTAELWRRHELENRQNNNNNNNNNNKSSAGLADLRLTFAALTTLKVMQLDNQFAAAKQTIVSSLLKASDGTDLMKIAYDLQPVDLVNEYLASLLSASALEEDEDEDDDSGNQELLQVATSRLVPLIEQHYQWGDGFVSYESDLPPPPSHQLLLSPAILAHYPVFNYLANVTATRAYRQLVNAFEDVFNYILIGRSVQNQSDGEYQSPVALQGLLLPLPVNLASKTFQFSQGLDGSKSRQQEADVGQLAASLLAVHLQAPGTSLQVGRLERLFDFITANLTRKWKPRFPYVKSFFDYTQEEKGEETDFHQPSMHYSQCNLGSTLALGARALEEHLQVMTSMDEKMRAEEVERYRKMAALGASLVDTCHRAAEAEVNFGSSDQFTLLPNGSIIHTFSEEDEHFDFSFSHHQLAEAYFVLHRLTGDPAYREYAWQMTEALHRKLLLSFKTSSSSSKSNQLPPQLFSATLKYLYLVQASDDQLPLERWLFSQPAGHPLPVLGSIEWADDGGGYEEDDGDNGGDRLVVGASFYRPRGGGGGGGRNHRNQGATTIIISESPDLN